MPRPEHPHTSHWSRMSSSASSAGAQSQKMDEAYTLIARTRRGRASTSNRLVAEGRRAATALGWERSVVRQAPVAGSRACATRAQMTPRLRFGAGAP
jgi:hypothetical protein